jgi:hypothetical protein
MFQVSLLSDLLGCSFASLWPLLLRRDPQNFVFKKPHLGGMFNMVNVASMRTRKVRLMILAKSQETCQLAATRVAKVIRMTLEDARPLLTSKLNLKVIFLLRDPRAVLNSLLRAPDNNQFPAGDVTKEAVCDNAFQDVSTFVRIQKYNEDLNRCILPVSYNRFISDPKIVRELFAVFLNLTAEQNALAEDFWQQRFGKKRTKGKRINNQTVSEDILRYFGTVREVGYKADHWKSNGLLNSSVLNWIEANEECQFAIKFIQNLDGEK